MAHRESLRLRELRTVARLLLEVLKLGHRERLSWCRLRGRRSLLPVAEAGVAARLRGLGR